MQRKFYTSINMKRIFFLFAIFIIGAAPAFSQDIIVLKNGDDIQAIVQKVGIDEVEYKKFDNPNGPNYTLKKSDIFSIKFVNGSKDVFTESAPTAPEPAANQPEIQSRRDSNIDYAAFTRLRDDDDAMEEFLRNNDAELYKKFHTGASLRETGKVLLGVGLGLTASGIVLFAIGVNQNNNNDDNGAGLVLGIAGMAGFFAGQALTIVSIPLSAVGGGLKRQAANGYEEKYFNNVKKRSQTSLNLTFTGNGIGLAFRF